MILCLAPNPSVDRSILVRGYRLGAIHRPEKVVAVAGGKGLNVARSIKRLGGEVKACALLAGHNGRWILEQLEGEGIPAVVAWSTGETRICTSVVDPQDWHITEIYERGEPINSQAWEDFVRAYTAALEGVSWVTFSGSLLPGSPEGGYASLLALAHEHALPVAVDVSGQFLRQVLPLSPQVVKVNATEAGEFAGMSVDSPESALRAARVIQEMTNTAEGVVVVITLGEHGAVALSEQGSWYGRPPSLPAIALVGSGDAFLAGLILELERGTDLPQALRTAIAVGAANALEIGQAVFDVRVVEEIKPQIEITTLN